MTTETGTDHFVVVNRVAGNRCPVSREHIMAGVAIVGRVDVTRILTAGRHAIVTGDTVANKATVINRRNRRPVCGDMAVVAFQRSLYMSTGLTLCNHIVVAT